MRNIVVPEECKENSFRPYKIFIHHLVSFLTSLICGARLLLFGHFSCLAVWDSTLIGEYFEKKLDLPGFC